MSTTFLLMCVIIYLHTYATVIKCTQEDYRVMGIKNRLNDLLKERHMNANELASKINVTPSTIYSILQRDSARIDIDLIMKIAHGLGVTADELLSDEIEDASHPYDVLLDDEGRKLLIEFNSLSSGSKDRLLAYIQILRDMEQHKSDDSKE